MLHYHHPLDSPCLAGLVAITTGLRRFSSFFLLLHFHCLNFVTFCSCLICFSALRVLFCLMDSFMKFSSFVFLSVVLMFLWIPLLLHHYLHVTMKPNNPVKNVFQCVSYINSVKCIYLKYMLLVSNSSFFQGLQRSYCEEIAWWCLTLLFVCHTASRGKERTQCCERGPYAEEVRHQVWDTYKWIRDPPRRLTAGKASNPQLAWNIVNSL